MACQRTLDQLVRKFEQCRGGHGNCPGRDQWLNNREIARRRHQEFLTLFPFRENPGDIDALTPERLYNPGTGNDYFFLWIVNKLYWLGGIKVGDAKFLKNAADNLNRFRSLLRLAVDDGNSLADKLNAPWDAVKGFGGDRHIAKKVVATYYPEKTLPIFATPRLEYHAGPRVLDVDIEAESGRRFGMRYSDVNMKVGQKWELLTEALLARKGHCEALRKEDNVYFMNVLEHDVPQRYRS